MARSTPLVILKRFLLPVTYFPTWGRKRFLLPVTYFPTVLVFCCSLQVTGILVYPFTLRNGYNKEERYSRVPRLSRYPLLKGKWRYALLLSKARLKCATYRRLSVMGVRVGVALY